MCEGRSTRIRVQETCIALQGKSRACRSPGARDCFSLRTTLCRMAWFRLQACPHRCVPLLRAAWKADRHPASYVIPPGGPCGVVASIQAWVVKKILDWNGAITANLSQQEAQQALGAALASIVWQAGDGSRAAWVMAPEEEPQAEGPCRQGPYPGAEATPRRFHAVLPRRAQSLLVQQLCRAGAGSLHPGCCQPSKTGAV